MTFAFNFLGMLSSSSRVALAMSVAAAGCVTTDPIEFSPEENFPPSIISQSTAQYPLRDIGDLDLDDPVAEPELPLQVVVRDPNIDQTLQYRIFIDSPTPPGNDPPVEQDELPPTGEVDRFSTFTIPYDLLTPAGECHKVELLVSGRFASPVEPRRPLQEGDVDGVTWWIRVTDADFPVITVECR